MTGVALKRRSRAANRRELVEERLAFQLSPERDRAHLPALRTTMRYMHLSPAPVNWAIRVLDAPQVWGA